MQIKNEYPPNFDTISAILPVSSSNPAIFCYSDTIYNPFDLNVTPDLELHEQVHNKQQGAEPDKWWYNYLKDPQFRLEQELEAYAHQWAFIKKHIKNKQALEWGIFKIAEALSSPLYGNLITFNEAESKVKKLSKQYASS